MQKAQLKMHWKVRERKNILKEKKRYQGPEKIGAKNRYYREIQSEESRIEKGNIRKILNNKKNMKKKQGNPTPKEGYEKNEILGKS